MAINPWLRAAAASAPGQAVYGSVLRNARIPTLGQQFPIQLPFRYTRAGNAADSNTAYGEDIPQELPAIENPEAVETALERLRRGERPPTESNATTTSTNGSPAPGSQRDGESPETYNALREFQANLRAQHMTTEPQPRQLSVLDMLRNRMQSQIDDESNQRLREIGIGMLRSRSPNFFTALGEGFAAAEEGSRARMDRLRQLAEAERQERALDVEEARRQEELRIREAAQAAEAPLRAAQTRQALAYADFLGRDRGQGQITVSQRLQAERDAASRARIAHPDLPAIPPPTAAQQAELQRLREAYIARELPRLLAAAANPGQVSTAPAAAPAAPAVPTIEVNPVGRQAR